RNVRRDIDEQSARSRRDGCGERDRHALSGAESERRGRDGKRTRGGVGRAREGRSATGFCGTANGVDAEGTDGSLAGVAAEGDLEVPARFNCGDVEAD